jgi:nucleotide-binding universal stress UspA family protein
MAEVLYETVLVPLDGTVKAIAGLTKALSICRDHGARLVLLRAVEPSEAGCGSTGALDSAWRSGYDLRRSQAEGYLQGIARALLPSGVNVEIHVTEGPQTDVLLRTARALPRPLVVLTAGVAPSPGATGLPESDALLVAGELSLSCIPVLLVPARPEPRD